MKIYRKITFLVASLLWSCAEQTMAMDMELCQEKQGEKLTVYESAHLIHERMHHIFGQLKNLHINKECVPENNVVQITPKEKQIYNSMFECIKEVELLFKHLPSQVKSHFYIDIANFFYYAQWKGGINITFEKIYSLFKNSIKEEDAREEDRYYKHYSLSKICKNELSPFKRYKHLDPIEIGSALLVETRYAGRYSNNYNQKLSRFTDLMSAGMLVDTDNRNQCTNFPFKEDRASFIEIIHTTIAPKITQPETKASFAFKQNYNLIQMVMETEVEAIKNRETDKVASAQEMFQFFESLDTVTLYEPKICQEFSQYLQKGQPKDGQ